MPVVTALRTLAGAQYVSGAVVLIAPDAVGRSISQNQLAPPSWLVRLLGARTLS